MDLDGIMELMNRDKRNTAFTGTATISAKVALEKTEFGENGVTKKSRAVLSSAVRYRGTYARARSESIIRKYKEAPIKENAA